MIDEKVLIKKMWNKFNSYYNDANRFIEEVTATANMVLSDVQKMIEEQEKVGEWIPCSERLPEETDYYLVTVKGATKSTELYFSCQTGLWSDELENTYHVIAWQELPQAYEGK